MIKEDKDKKNKKTLEIRGFHQKSGSNGSEQMGGRNKTKTPLETTDLAPCGKM